MPGLSIVVLLSPVTSSNGWDSDVSDRTLAQLQAPGAAPPLRARNENDSGMRGMLSGKRHNRGPSGTMQGKPFHGRTSCSWNMVIVIP